MKKYSLYLIIFSMFYSAYCQSNVLIYRGFLKEIVEQEGAYFFSYNAYHRQSDSLFFKMDSLSKKRILPQQWEITYHKMGKKQYLRALSLTMKIVEADTFRFIEKKYQDTLLLKEIKQLLKTETTDFQGKNPFWQELYLKPAAMIASSAAIVCILFYVRSQ